MHNGQRRCAVALMIGAFVLPGWPLRQGHAQHRNKVAIGILPFQAQGHGLDLYSKPAADEVARKLSNGTWRVGMVSEAGGKGVALLLAGRIVARGRNRLSFEVKIREPVRGRNFAVVSTSTLPLSKIDRLAAQLVNKLRPAISKALKERARLISEEKSWQRRIRLPKVVVRGKAQVPPKNTREKPVTPREVLPSQARHTRRLGPRLAVFPATGRVNDERVTVAALMMRAAFALSRRLGFQPVQARTGGDSSARAVAGEANRVKARYALLLFVQGIRFDYAGVLTARGEVRVVVRDTTGVKRYERVVETDTLIGSRGDGQSALVRLVGEQAMDIVFPELRRVLAK